MFNKIFGSKRSKIISMVVCAAMAITLLGVFVSSTFAQTTHEEIFKDPNEGYFHLEVGVTRNRSVSGAYAWTNSNDSNLTLTSSTQNRGTATLVAKQAGATVVTVGSQQGDLESFNYQITDSRNITSYTMANGGEIKISNGEIGKADLKDVYSVITPTPNTAYVKDPATSNNGGIKWTSTNKNVATVREDGKITAVSEGTAILFGTVNDKWGVAQTIPAVVLVGSNASTNIIEDGEGGYWIPGDKDGIYFEADGDGQVLVPPHIIYDPDGPGTGTPSIDLERGDNGKYYVQDSINPGIWHEFDTEAGTTVPGSDIWVGGPTQKPGNGNDKSATQDTGGNWWIGLGQNIFDRVNPNGTAAGDLVGGGNDELPWTSPVRPIVKVGDKYYVEVNNGDYYYGDKLVGGNGKVMSSTTTMDSTDQKFYWDANTQTMTTTPPTGSGVIEYPAGSGNYYKPVPGSPGVWQQTDASGNGLVPSVYVGGDETAPNPSIPLYKINPTVDNTKTPPASGFDNTYTGYLTKSPSGTCEYDRWLYAVNNPVKVDDTFYMGSDIRDNKMQWQVLAVDAANNRMLIIPTTVVAECKFHNKTPYPGWRNSDMRTFLNGSFYNNYFTAAERARILLTDVGTKLTYKDTSLDVTQDYVYLLSEDEIKAYWSTNKQRIPKYTYSGDTSGASGTPTQGNSWGENRYWLRNPKCAANYASYITNDGSLQYTSVNYGYDIGTYPNSHFKGGVRPVMWVTIN